MARTVTGCCDLECDRAEKNRDTGRVIYMVVGDHLRSAQRRDTANRPDLPRHAATGVAQHDAELAGLRTGGLDPQVRGWQVEAVHGAARTHAAGLHTMGCYCRVMSISCERGIAMFT